MFSISGTVLTLSRRAFRYPGFDVVYDGMMNSSIDGGGLEFRGTEATLKARPRRLLAVYREGVQDGQNPVLTEHSFRDGTISHVENFFRVRQERAKSRTRRWKLESPPLARGPHRQLGLPPRVARRAWPTAQARESVQAGLSGVPYCPSPSSRIQILRKRTGLSWSCRLSGQLVRRRLVGGRTWWPVGPG